MNEMTEQEIKHQIDKIYLALALGRKGMDAAWFFSGGMPKGHAKGEEIRNLLRDALNKLDEVKEVMKKESHD